MSQEFFQNFHSGEIDNYRVLLFPFRTGGCQIPLAKHFAHIFQRDPLIITRENTLCDDDSVGNEHFENLQSTNWQPLRFKPPPPGTDIGWRVEFRVLDNQITAYENAAYVVTLVLITKAIIQYDLDLLALFSLVDENMRRAVKRNAVLNGR